jgi:hypothetical protein
MEKRRFYIASDYAGLELKNGLKFYYGYERTHCEHGPDAPFDMKDHPDDCEADWCFVAERDGKEVFRCTREVLLDSFEKLEDETDLMDAMLLAGVGLYMETL